MDFRLLLTALLLLGACAAEPPEGLLGAYRLDDGRTLSIRRSADETLRYRFFDDGSSGRLYRLSDDEYISGAGFSQREPVELTVRFRTDANGNAQQLEWLPAAAAASQAQRIGTERELRFDSDGAQLFGRLHLPDSPPPYSAVVLVHGSGSSPATEWYYNADFFVANGIAAFVYDKRGTGRSGGEFTFDFRQLARDGVAAVETVAGIPEIDGQSIGLSGYSQGAWVAPLAASMSDSIRFVIVNYGMIESPAEEARLEMRQLLVDANTSEADIAEADDLIRAAVDLVANGLESGWPRFEKLREKHRDADWVRHLDGTPVDQLMSYPKFLVQWIGKRQLPRGLDWHYDSTELLKHSTVPMVWLLAGQDRSAPNEQTIAKLRSFAAAGKPLRLEVFSDADHSMLTFTETDGVRAYEGYAPGYFQSEVEAVNWLLAFAQEKSASD
jgi:alpha-beta hydrolase superfamily lysophospholipase